MSRSHRLEVASGMLAMFGFLATGPAFAQSRHGYRQVPRGDNPTYSGVPNVPDDQGCVKWCFRDLGPCDPPEFKRADGRCNLFD